MKHILLSCLLALAFTTGCKGGNSQADCQATADLLAMCGGGSLDVDACVASDDVMINSACVSCSKSATDPCTAPNDECMSECQ